MVLEVAGDLLAEPGSLLVGGAEMDSYFSFFCFGFAVCLPLPQTKKIDQSDHLN
jgi:hypothetical protein